MRNVYKIHEVNKHRFYQVPKELFENEYYSDLSSDAKLLYGMLLDRMKLSEKNNWINENNEIFLIFTRDQARELLNISSKSTITNVFNELKEKKLIFEERQGLNKPNIIFIGKIDYKKRKKQAEKPENSGKYKNCTSRGTENGLQEVQNLYSNDTELNDPDLNDTEIEKRVRKNSNDIFPPSFEVAVDIFNASNYEEENIRYYLRKYKNQTGKMHPNLKLNQWDKVIDSIIFAEDQRLSRDEELLGDLFKEVVDQHFKTDYKDCDYNILHFISGQIMMNRYYEVS